jgi:hypothetical protein
MPPRLRGGAWGHPGNVQARGLNPAQPSDQRYAAGSGKVPRWHAYLDPADPKKVSWGARNPTGIRRPIACRRRRAVGRLHGFGAGEPDRSQFNTIYDSVEARGKTYSFRSTPPARAAKGRCRKRYRLTGSGHRDAGGAAGRYCCRDGESSEPVSTLTVKEMIEQIMKFPAGDRSQLINQLQQRAGGTGPARS